MPDAPLFGQQGPLDGNSLPNIIAFAVQQLLARIETVALVKVMAVSNTGGLAAAGTVDVSPLVNQVDGAGQAIPHGTIYGLPYLRLQGGANAVILDPQVGDIGICGFASRDISAVKATRARANPGSFRRFAAADGLYFGGVLNGVPSQIVRFSTTGIDLTSPVAVSITAPAIALNGAVAITGTLTDNGHDVGSTHRHGGVSTGSGNSGTPL